MTGKTTYVENMRHLPKGWEKDPDFVYCGRAGHGHDGYFGNPIPLEAGEPRGATLEKFKSYFYDRLDRDPVYNERVRALKGKVLVCFCKPLGCHCDIIKEFLDGESA